ncbi:hypothetical protein K502DRAFT_324263, partial [Neoconidiobolus thromboides FSU 785]
MQKRTSSSIQPNLSHYYSVIKTQSFQSTQPIHNTNNNTIQSNSTSNLPNPYQSTLLPLPFRACDECRYRKVKCQRQDELMNCELCVKKGLNCKFNNPVLKRGPKVNKEREKEVVENENVFKERDGGQNKSNKRSKKKNTESEKKLEFGN